MMSERGKRELWGKVAALVGAGFGGRFEAAFGHYGRHADGRAGWDGVGALLADAGVGNWSTRTAWSAEVMLDLDRDRNGRVGPAAFVAAYGVPTGTGTDLGGRS
jgi:hypothetical protein